MSAFPLAAKNVAMLAVESELRERRADVRRLELMLSQLAADQDPTQSGVQAVTRALGQADSPLAVWQIAERTGLPQNSVRVYLYAHPEQFEKTKLSPRRVLWSLAPEVEEAHHADG